MSYQPTAAGLAPQTDGPTGFGGCESMLEQSAQRLARTEAKGIRPVTFRALSWAVGETGGQTAITFEVHGGQFVRIVLDRDAGMRAEAAMAARQLTVAAPAPKPAPVRPRGPAATLTRAQLCAALREYAQLGGKLTGVAARYHLTPATLASHFRREFGATYVRDTRYAVAAGPDAVAAYLASVGATHLSGSAAPASAVEKENAQPSRKATIATPPAAPEASR